ncbi:hypothetical protein [Paenibacillus periandrae]|uniref:hypothetical protein n=1 Tax=Paenibacillus periandrae TaxID=1761741 RepID=UPI00308457A1
MFYVRVMPSITESEPADSITDEQASQLMKVYRRNSVPASAIARAIMFAIEQTDDVDVNELVVRPTVRLA